MKDLRKELEKQAKNSAKKTTNKDAITQILDENNAENVILYDPMQKPIEFEQIALIPLEDSTTANQNLYAIMIPITPMQGVNEGEGVIFEIDALHHDIKVVNNQDIIDRVIAVYEKLLKQGN